MAERPNILLVCTDQQRMDSLACYGNRFVSSPGTDAMAAAGMAFDSAFTPWPVCTPARGTMWTGVYPHTHGVIDNVYGVDNAFATHARFKETVFERLQAAGYLTAHFGKWHLGENKPPFFDVWEESFNSRFGHWIDGKLDGEYRPDRCTASHRPEGRRGSALGSGVSVLVVQRKAEDGAPCRFGGALTQAGRRSPNRHERLCQEARSGDLRAGNPGGHTIFAWTGIRRPSASSTSGAWPSRRSIAVTSSPVWTSMSPPSSLKVMRLERP